MQREPADYSEPPGPDDDADAGEAVAGVVSIEALDGAGERVDRFVASRLSDVSRTRVQRWIALGAVTVDGATVLPRHRLRGHEKIAVVPLPTEAERAFEPDPVPLVLVHEDPDLAVVDKPAGLVAHPAPGHWRGTLMNGVLHRWPDAAALPRAGIVHRLDKDTSGLMLVARSELGFERLGAMIAARTVRRRYLAVVEGRFAGGTIDAPVGRDPRDRLRMSVVAAGRGKTALTEVVRLASGESEGRTCTLLECRLQTGRTHQIRVHLSSRGHPLVGDVLYGGRPLRGCVRQALHAWRLGLPHPRSGAALDFRSPPPPDLAALLDALGLGAALAALLASA